MNSEQTYLIRKEFAHLSTIYFNSAYFGPSPFRAKIKIEKAMQKELDPSFYDYNTWMGSFGSPPAVRLLFSAGADGRINISEFGLISNCSRSLGSATGTAFVRS